MTTKTLHQVSVPGATLHCEVSGNGPFLLLLPGGGTDAAAFDGILPQLAEHYTVVSYDPRGSARSPYAGAPADDRIDQVAEDALAVLNSVGVVEPAYVFGSSNGAITALELLVRHPDRIRLLVAHEPPAMGLLPDATSALEFFHDVHDTYQRSGRAAADDLFFDGIGIDEVDRMPEPADLPPEFRELAERMHTNGEVFYGHKLLPMVNHRPDVPALVASKDKLVPAVGAESSEFFPAGPILTLSEQQGWSVVTFPGGHVGYLTDPYEFATLLLQVLSGKVAR